MIPVIVDCDPGHDDALALWLALGSPMLDVRAVTTVGGNVALEHTSRNARVVLTVAGIHDVPVAAGAAGPLERALETAEWIHGKNGLGGPDLPEPAFPLDPRDAVTLIRDVLAAAEGPVSIVATGPLTNIATLLRDHPESSTRIDRVVWMGGSTERGNVTPYAEFNAWVDPEAVDVVLTSGVPLTMVGLNVTHQALLTPTVRAHIAGLGNRTAAFAEELFDFFCRTNDQVFGMPDGPLHDPVAVAVLADPACVGLTRTRLDIELTGTHTRGATCADLDSMSPLPHNAHVATTIDVERFWRLIRDALARLA